MRITELVGNLTVAVTNEEDSLLEKSTEILDTCSLKKFLCFFKVKNKKSTTLNKKVQDIAKKTSKPIIFSYLGLHKNQQP